MKDNYLYDEELHENLKRPNNKKKIYFKKTRLRKCISDYKHRIDLKGSRRCVDERTVVRMIVCLSKQSNARLERSVIINIIKHITYK